MEIIKSKHVGCYGVIVNSNNEVLLIKKSRGAYKGKLDLPGGGMEYGETAEETLKRELQEEAGIIIEDYKLKTVVTHYEVWQIDENLKEDLSHIAIIYDIKLPDNYTIKTAADGQDSLGSSWYKIDDLSLEELSPLAACIKE